MTRHSPSERDIETRPRASRAPRRLAPWSLRAIALTAFVAVLAVACAAPSEHAGAGDSSSEEGAVGSLAEAALGEALNATPTAWWWYFGQTPAQVASLLSANDARLVSLQVESVSPLRLTVAMVANTGTHAKTWWWYHGQTASQLGSLVSSLNARIVDIDAYDDNGTTRFAAVLLSNTGADAKAWWWYFGQTTAQIGALLTQNDARLIDLHAYQTGGSTRYAAVMISNTGADARAWWWYFGVSGADVGTLLSQNAAMLTSIQPANGSGTTFNVVMQQEPGAVWWWYFGQTDAQLTSRFQQNGARLLDVKSYFVSGSRRFAAILVNNSNAATTRVGEILRGNTSGATGLYLKRIGGGVEASLQENFAYDPASSIKTLIGLHAMRQIQPPGGLTLSSSINVFAPTPGSSCPSSNVTGTESMSNALSEMLVLSDNQRTRAFIDRFGFSSIQQTATNIGMASTSLVIYPGCNITNRMTLSDASRMYEGIHTATLINATSRNDLYARMPADGGDFTGIVADVNAIVDQEAPAFGLSASRVAAYKSRFRSHYKAGGDDWNGLQYRTVAGVAEIPRCSGASVAFRNYVFGIFVHDAPSPSGDFAFNAAKSETLREPLRSGLSTWASCSP